MFDVPRGLELKLALPIVLPLVELIQHQADLLKAAGQTLSQDEEMRQEVNSLEVQRLLSLFRPDFSRTGRITITESGYPTVLRACAFLRLQMRGNALSVIPDATLESGLDADKYAGEELRAVTCYLFLATLQELLLKHFPVRAPLLSSGWSDLYTAIGNLFSKWKTPPKPIDAPVATPSAGNTSGVWQVVVQNDPVNLMNYVTAVLGSVLGLPEEIATQRMREVHELKSSMVWEGPKDKAESYVRTLQSWHLQAVIRPV